MDRTTDQPSLIPSQHRPGPSPLAFSLELPFDDLANAFSRMERAMARQNARVVRDDRGSALLVLGDLVLPAGSGKPELFLRSMLGEQGFDHAEVLQASGTFVLIGWWPVTRRIEICSGFGGLTPIYYVDREGACHLATDLSRLRTWGGEIDEVYLAERLLFNYPLTDRTLLKNVRRLPAHHALVIGPKGVTERRFLDVGDLFQAQPLPYAERLDELQDLFLRELRQFVPETPFSLSFTSGFDGRTLLAACHRLGARPDLYAFGVSQADDVRIPREQARQLGYTFEPIYLDRPQYQEAALPSGIEMIRLSSGEANFARAHYHYASRKLAERTDTILTGNFGSEIFRAFHNPGVMCSRWLYHLFLHNGRPEVADLAEAPELDFLHPDLSRTDLVREMLAGLENRAWFAREDLSLNKRFYIFVFEEMFRKYFGPELTVQSHYLVNRTPFLNYRFVRALYQTDLGGPYNPFFVHSKAKRLKGQVFYGSLIHKSYPRLSEMMTGKGYRPKDLVGWQRPLRLAMALLRKKVTKKDEVPDPHRVYASFAANEAYWLDHAKANPFFDRTALGRASGPEGPNARYTALSIVYYLENLLHG